MNATILLKKLWLRLTNESSPMFKAITRVITVVCLVAGGIDLLHTANLYNIPDNIAGYAHEIWKLGISGGIVSKLTLKNPEIVLSLSNKTGKEIEEKK